MSAVYTSCYSEPAHDAVLAVTFVILLGLGASSLLNDVLMQIRKEKTGRYQSPDYFTVD